MITLIIPEPIQKLIPNNDEAFTLDIVRMNTSDSILTVSICDISMGFKINIYEHELSDITKLSMFTKDHHTATGRIHLKKSEGEIFEIFRIEMHGLSERQEVDKSTEVNEAKSTEAEVVADTPKPNCDCESCNHKQQAPSKAAGCSFKDRPKTKY